MRAASTLVLSLFLSMSLPAAISLERPIVYELDDRSAHLTLADLDTDGRLDILATNNSEGTIDILYGRSEEEIEEAEEPDPKPHQPEELITGRVVDDLAVGDLDGDGLPDIVVGSERGGAAVFFQTEPRTFETARRLRAPGKFVIATDLDGDGTDEVLAVSGRETPASLTCLREGGDREMQTVWRVPLTAEPGETPRLADWDGDGDLDLLWASSNVTQAHVLLAESGGGFGGERLIDLGQTLDWAPMESGDRMTLLALERASGIVRLLAPGEPHPSEEASSFGAPVHVALPEEDPADRVAVVAGRLGTEGEALFLPAREAAEALVITVDGSRQVSRAVVPSFSEVDAAQRLPDGSLLLVSGAEGTVGIAPPPLEGTVPPQPLPIALEPLAAVVGEFDDESGNDLIVIGRGEERDLIAHLMPQFDDEDAEDVTILELTNLPEEDPVSMRAADIDGDGLDDLTIFYRYHAPVIFLRADDGWVPLSDVYQVPGTFFDDVKSSQLGVADITGDDRPEVLLARGGLVRVLSFAEPPQVTVLAQINAPRPGGNISAVAGAPGPDPMIIAIDSNESVALICRPGEEGGWEIASEVDLQLQSPQRIAVGDWDGDGIGDFAVKGSQAVGLFFGGVTVPPLEQWEARDSPLEEGRLAWLDTAAWDDGPPWAHVIDHRHHTLLIWSWDAEAEEWEDVYRFRVYETPGDMRRDWEIDLERVTVQPRELAVGDIDGDGVDDLVLLAHRHLLVYPRRDQ